MRYVIVCAALAAVVIPSEARADDEICFINNSSQEIKFGAKWGDNQVFNVMPANSGDRNLCHDEPMYNDQSITGDISITYLEISVSTDGTIADTVIYVGGSPYEASSMDGPNQLTNMGIAFLNPAVGQGTFYYANPYGYKTQSISNSKLEWAQNDLVCNKVLHVCRSWNRGNDGVYRITWTDMAPTGYTPAPPSQDCENPLSPCYNG